MIYVSTNKQHILLHSYCLNVETNQARTERNSKVDLSPHLQNGRLGLDLQMTPSRS